ncbi:MAG: BMP family ABC transporter substrate-binding protein, partial [Oscillospiraceae bacterium]|nr:BMP family ABC transporter substrate-binding protein [Oscillospiraceae bacterium]
MKKIIALMLALVMVLSMAACGAKAPEAAPEVEAPEAEAPEAEPTFEFDNDSTPFDTTTLTADELANVKVGFIFLHDENSTYDLNFLTAAKSVCEKLNVEHLIKVNIPESEACYDAAAELVDEGCNIIFADSFGQEPY